MTDNLVKCQICGVVKSFKEITRRFIVEGEKVYICKKCSELVRQIPDDEVDCHWA